MPGSNVAGTVQLGSTVFLEKNGVLTKFQILGSHETDPSQGRISHRSPLGVALMNHAKGDSVIVQTAKGPQEYRIIDIK